MPLTSPNTQAIRDALRENYGKYWSGDSRPSIPKVAFIDPTSSCNHSCRGCLFGENGVFKNIRGYNTHLSVEKIESALIDMAELQIPRIHFTGGGEPLLHPDIIRILKKAKKLGFRYGVTSSLSVPLPEELSSLLAGCTPNVLVSLWTYNREKYKSWHGKDDFELFIENVKKLKDKGVSCQVAYVLWKENIDDLGPTLDLVKSLGCISMSVIPAYSQGKTDTLSQEDKDRASKILEEKKGDITIYSFLNLTYSGKRFKNCNYPYLRCHIDSMGYVYPCWIHKYTPDCSYGNINKRRFKDIILDPSRTRNLKNFICETNFCKFQGTRKGVEL